MRVDDVDSLLPILGQRVPLDQYVLTVLCLDSPFSLGDREPADGHLGCLEDLDRRIFVVPLNRRRSSLGTTPLDGDRLGGQQTLFIGSRCDLNSVTGCCTVDRCLDGREVLWNVKRLLCK